jgi:hypothetical protein
MAGGVDPSTLAGMLPPDILEKIESIKQEAFANSGGGPDGFIENVQAFGAAVDWSETWIQCLLALQVIVFVSVIALRHVFELQVFLFAMICILVFSAEYINAFAQEHWKEFAGQDYFDKRGVFTSTLLSGPLLISGFTLMICTLFVSADLLVKVKRTELMHKQRAKSKKAKEGTAVAGGGKKDD